LKTGKLTRKWQVSLAEDDHFDDLDGH
jgi:hypothetical protein